MTPCRTALIVAHGQPSDPEPAEAEIARLAVAVEALLPGWRVASATLAAPDSLAQQVARLGAGGQVYPLFMSGGWFTRVHLPERLAQAGGADWRVLQPFGEDPAVQDLTLRLTREALDRAGLPDGQGQVLLAAHGSFRSPAPAQVARAMAARLQADLGLARVEPAFIDQSPRIAEVARTMGAGAIVVPFFAARGGHVIDDLPAALSEAAFAGTVLDPVGLDPRVPGLIAAALRRAA